MTDTAGRILIVDDDVEFAASLSRGLNGQGYDTVAAHRADAGVEHLRDGGFTAAIVDVMIGPDSGIDLVRKVRHAGVKTPVLMLSALSEVDDRAAGLEAGANDYIVKPFSFDELLARLRVQERRAASGHAAAALDSAGWTLSVPGRQITLTQREYSLLHMFSDHAGQVLSRPFLFETLWAGEGASSENVVDVYVGYLRRKLDPSMDFGFEIKTLRNKGFRLDGTPPSIS